MTADIAGFNCQDYLDSEYAKSGCWHSEEQIWTLVSRGDVEVLHEQRFLMVGRAGVDGILFGYRALPQNLWVRMGFRG